MIKSLVQHEDFFEHKCQAPPIQNQVVKIEDEFGYTLRHTDQRKTHQRRLREIESKLTILSEKTVQF